MSQSTAKRVYQNLDNVPQTDNNLALQYLEVHSTRLVQRVILAELNYTTVCFAHLQLRTPISLFIEQVLHLPLPLADFLGMPRL